MPLSYFLHYPHDTNSKHSSIFQLMSYQYQKTSTHLCIRKHISSVTDNAFCKTDFTDNAFCKTDFLNLIRNSKPDAKIDAKSGTVIMEPT